MNCIFIILFVYYYYYYYVFISYDVWKKHRYNYMYTCSLLILCIEFHITRMEINFFWSFPHPPRKELNMPLLKHSNNKQQPPYIILAATCLYCYLVLVFVTPCTTQVVNSFSVKPGGSFSRKKVKVHSCQQKSIGLKFSKSQTGSDVRYSCRHNSSRFTFPIFAHSWRFSVLHSLQSITPRIY